MSHSNFQHEMKIISHNLVVYIGGNIIFFINTEIYIYTSFPKLFCYFLLTFKIDFLYQSLKILKRIKVYQI